MRLAAFVPIPMKPALSVLPCFAFFCASALAADVSPAAGARMGSMVVHWDKIELKPVKTGARATIFEAPTATLDKFHCHVSTLNPGENTGAPHRHPQEELVVVKSGTLEVNIDGRIETAETGSMVFYAANELENMRNPGTVPATYYVFQFFTPATPKN
jgi:mannose-6-phosphate isomerase-like protein (cupin superfamily)